jgi:plastocyanin
MLFLLSTQPAGAETHEVVLLDEPPFTMPGPMISVKPGDTITWVSPPREGGGMHTITQSGCFTGDACEFDSEIILPEDEFSYTFEEPGVYRYRCRQHFAMKGKIYVESEKAKKKRLRKERKASRRKTEG